MRVKLGCGSFPKRSGTCFNARMAQPYALSGPSRLTIRQIADLAASRSRRYRGCSTVAATSPTRLASRHPRPFAERVHRPCARGLSAGRTGLVGILVPLVYPASSPRSWRGRPRRSQSRDLQIVLSPTGARARPRGLGARPPPHVLTDGALIILPEESSEELERLARRGYRFVVLDPWSRSTSGSRRCRRPTRPARTRRCATCSNSGIDGSQQITGPRGWVATDDRRRGYRAALASAGILPDPALEVEAEPEIAPRRDAALYLLDLPEPPTAIFAFNDNIAIGAIQAARARGLRVPEDQVDRRLRRRRARHDRHARRSRRSPPLAEIGRRQSAS